MVWGKACGPFKVVVADQKENIFSSSSGEKLPDMTEASHKNGIWRSRVSWNIALSVFATIVVIQTAIMVFTVTNIEEQELREVREQGLAAIAPSLILQKDTFKSPLTKDQANRLFETTLLKGIGVYGMDLGLISNFGEPTILHFQSGFEPGKTYRSVDNSSYEVIYTSGELGRPYFIIAKLNSTKVEPAIIQYVKQNVLIVLLLSGFVTSVLMLALSQWLLEPILLMRRNMINAVRNPEEPDIEEYELGENDEVTTTINIANDLIRQNALNLVKLKQQAEDKIHKLAYYDALTNLPNRSLFTERLEESIREDVLGKDKSIVVMALDLDHFKDINDSMGHEIGDLLLEAVAERLVNATPDHAIVARASADEFSIMVTLDGEVSQSADIVNEIFASLAQPVSILQEQFQIRASVGLAHCPQDGMEAGHIMKNADIALNRAKEDGRDTYRYYSEDFDKAVQARFQMLRDLRIALDEGQLNLHYHPQFDLKTGQMIGAEALLRWWKPDNSREGGRYISPADFVPVAEQSGLIVPIGEWVLKTACEMTANWQKEGLPPFRIAVNISGVQFHRGDIVAVVKRTLEETELDPKYLELEVTESVFMDDVHFTIGILEELHSLGCELAVDDFGTGYSSLSYLRQFPIDRLKIDQSFIRDALVNKDDQAITRTIINLGHSLGLKVIAEGVETTDHEKFLQNENCDEVQGFKYTKPIPEEDLKTFARHYNNDLERPEVA